MGVCMGVARLVRRVDASGSETRVGARFTVHPPDCTRGELVITD